MSAILVNEKTNSSVENPKDLSTLSLVELGAKISALHDEAGKFAGFVRQAASHSLECALAAGQALLVAKKRVPHGEWTAWRKTNVPGMSEDQAGRYMRLVREIPHVRKLDDIKTVRQAYLACGIIKDPAKKSTKPDGDRLDKKTALAPSDFVSRFQSLRSFLENTAARLEWGKISSPERSEMDSDLEKIIQLLGTIRDRLDKIDLPASDAATGIKS